MAIFVGFLMGLDMWISWDSMAKNGDFWWILMRLMCQHQRALPDPLRPMIHGPDRAEDIHHVAAEQVAAIRNPGR